MRNRRKPAAPPAATPAPPGERALSHYVTVAESIATARNLLASFPDIAAARLLYLSGNQTVVEVLDDVLFSVWEAAREFHLGTTDARGAFATGKGE
jgi:hypothetical protein